MGRLIAILVLCWACLLPVAGAKRALLIGISAYPKTQYQQLNWHNIHGANDVALLAATLKRQGFAVATLTGAQARAAAVRKALKTLSAKSRPGDLVYVHFSGHGQPVEDRNGDEADGWDEALVPYDAGQRYVAGVYDGRHHIIDDELNGCITALRRRVGKEGCVYVVIDACHSGGESRGDETADDADSVIVRGTNVGFSRSGKPFIPRIDKRPVIAIPPGKNLAPACYLEACRAYQSNCEIRVGGKYYGSLSYYVNQVLSRHRLTASTAWVETVRSLMSADRRLTRQNMVVERSVAP